MADFQNMRVGDGAYTAMRADVATRRKGATMLRLATGGQPARLADLLALGFSMADAQILVALDEATLDKVLPSADLFMMVMTGDTATSDPAVFVQQLAQQAGVTMPQGFGSGGQAPPVPSGAAGVAGAPGNSVW